MLHIPKIAGYLEILIEKEVKDFVAKIFGKYFKSTREESYSKEKTSKKLLNRLCFPNNAC